MLKAYKYPFWLSLAFFLVLLIFYLFTRTAPVQPGNAVLNNNNIEREIEHSLNNAELLFENVKQDLEEESRSVEVLIEQAQNSRNPRMAVFQRLNADIFWGVTIIREGEIWAWNGFELSMSDDDNANTTTTSILSRNNVIILQRESTFTTDGHDYTLLTAKLVSQTIDLPFENSGFFGLSGQTKTETKYPVSFNFFGPQPEEAVYRVLSLAGTDSIGTVYTLPQQASEFQEKIIISGKQWDYILQAGLIVTFFLVLFLGAWYRSSVYLFLIFIILVFSSWILFTFTGLPKLWASCFNEWISYDTPSLTEQLIIFSANSFHFFLLFLGISNILLITQKPVPSENHFRTIGFSVLLGIICTLFIIYPVYLTYTTLMDSGLSLIELQLAPGIPAFIFYIHSLLLFSSALGIIISVGRALNIREGEKPTLVILISTIIFFVLYATANVFVDINLIDNTIAAVSFSLFLVVIIIIYILHSNRALFESMSGFRRMMFVVLAVSVGVYGLIWSSYHKQLDKKLIEQVESYIDDDDRSPDDILFGLLADIESGMRELTLNDIENRRQPISNLFQRTVQTNLQDKREQFSYHIRLLTDNDQEISTYSTSIDTPAWNPFFNTDIMLRAYRGEQLRWQNNRPVIWERPTTTSERFTTYDIGWIPIYDSEQPSRIIAWVTGDIFKERLDYNKPIRAVLSAATKQDWKNSFYISEYVGDRLNNSAVVGIYHNQPHYLKLPDAELQITAQDSISYITNITRDHTFREVLVRHNDRRIIKASTPLPGFNLHIFSFFKMQIVMIFFGLFCCSLLASAGFHQFSLFGQSQRFSSRLIDGLALSTILFLTVLIFATRFTLTNQNEQNIERSLLNDLNGINESIKEKGIFLYEDVSPGELSEITTPLNLDMILYRDSRLEISTTPQIFQQHILPATMPFDVYYNLYNRERATFFSTTVINNEKLLIGFKSILNTEGRPVGAIAIPTFIESPVFVEQLLQTTSYLFVVYLGIFALFIAGTVVLSNQLTKPLKLIQQGLQKISQGTAESKVPVTSRDEIGMLALAYNNMVERLDEARKELVKAERESAWKEMAQQVAHEIKNPLTPMKLNLQHLQRQLEANPEDVLKLKPIIERTATNIIEQIETLNKIASDFSKFAKPMQAPQKKLDICKLAESVAALYEQNEQIEISVHQPVRKVYVIGAEDELRRAFINIIKNGIEAVEEPIARIEITIAVKQNKVLLSVKDNGSGITESDGNQIFIPRFSTKSSGTGLGLAITKKVIEAHSGTITVEETSSAGTTFLITLPLAK